MHRRSHHLRSRGDRTRAAAGLGAGALAGWDRPIAAGFAVGSPCFIIGPFPGWVQLVGTGADAAIFFAGSICFTFAALLELPQTTLRRGARFGRDATWWSAATQFVGTLLFNLDTYDALHTGLDVQQEDRLIWTPDLIGSTFFLISGVLAYRVAAHGGQHDRSWRMAAVNLAGCVLFGVSAIASYIVPATGSILDLAAANWGTSLGAACFLAGALMLWPALVSPQGGPRMTLHGPAQARLAAELDELGQDYGNRFLREASPDGALPEHGMRAVDAMRLLGEELALDGLPMRNLATFVTTWMEPEARRSSPRTCTGTSSTTRNIPRPRRSSSAASGCSPTCSTRPARPPARARRARPRRSCSARSRSSGSGASGARPRTSRPTARTSCSAATCTSCGRSSAATSTSSRGSSRCSRTST